MNDTYNGDKKGHLHPNLAVELEMVRSAAEAELEVIRKIAGPLADWQEEAIRTAFKGGARFGAERAALSLSEERRRLVACVPDSWLDSLLTGPDAVLTGAPGTWACPDIENLLRAIRERMEAL